MFFHEMSIMSKQHFSAMMGELLLKLIILFNFMEAQLTVNHVYFCMFVFRIIRFVSCVLVIDCQVFIYET